MVRPPHKLRCIRLVSELCLERRTALSEGGQCDCFLRFNRGLPTIYFHQRDLDMMCRADACVIETISPKLVVTLKQPFLRYNRQLMSCVASILNEKNCRSPIMLEKLRDLGVIC